MTHLGYRENPRQRTSQPTPHKHKKRIIFQRPGDLELYQQGYNWGDMGFDLTNLAYELLESRAFVQGYNDFVQCVKPVFDSSVAPLAMYIDQGVKRGSRRISTSQ